MILHIFTDDPKFTKLATEIFQQAEINSRYVVITSKENFAPDATSDAEIINPDTAAYQSLITSIPEYSLVVFHNMLGLNRQFTKDILEAYLPQRPPFAWVFWGAELYGHIEPVSSFLGKDTKKIYNKRYKERIVFFIKRYIYNRFNLKKLLSNFDYICSYIPQDIDRFNSRTHLQLKPLWFTYYPIEKLIGDHLLNQKVVDRGNILIGNSSNFTCNHLETFKMIQKFDLQGNKIIVPLNYGDKAYARQIAKKGEKLFDRNFIALMDFMPREEYNQLLLSCSAIILNLYRQQAMGNIITALWLGARVYLNDFTTAYQYLKGIGLHLYSIEKDLNNNQEGDPFTRLSDKQIEENRVILSEEFGTNAVIKKVKNSFKAFN
ncbi:MAG: TDP-N-acetylfucosamine:lipid II N-acetylfucosaminyltransferase [Bacteroidota bacterium]|nr:TDP-N-acetylfucosamine:lipid II N-acetylfucosaminyltransferase [Bacteroidota bacterium]